MLRYLWISLAAILLDQGSKLWVLSHFREYEVRELLPVFNLVLVYNTGAAFSLLSDAGGWQRGLFILLGVGVSAGLVVWLARLDPRERLTAWGLALVIGGALGNVIDRIVHGRVVDFLDLHWRAWHWPAFNLADGFITLGVVCLLWASLFPARQGRDTSPTTRR